MLAAEPEELTEGDEVVLLMKRVPSGNPPEAGTNFKNIVLLLSCSRIQWESFLVRRSSFQGPLLPAVHVVAHGRVRHELAVPEARVEHIPPARGSELRPLVVTYEPHLASVLSQDVLQVLLVAVDPEIIVIPLSARSVQSNDLALVLQVREDLVNLYWSELECPCALEAAASAMRRFRS